MSATILDAPVVERAPAPARLDLAWRHPLLALTLGAIALRLLLFLARGDYVAFDEAWYLILGHNLWSGRGFTLSGLAQVALSPLFPILAGGMGQLVHSAVWGGRIVAAVAAGLLVVPCWALFHRLGGRGTAVLGSAIVAVLPSLAPFVAPEFVGWDLWVGAGPLFHLFLFSGIALVLGAVAGETSRGGALLRWLAAGVAFGLAFLDRPEAILAGGLAGGAALMLGRGRLRRLPGAALCLVAFLALTGPYLLYLHDATGRWTLTGRGVSLGAGAVGRAVRTGVSSGGGSIEGMLWEGEQARYAEFLYRLDRTGTRMADSYWGVPRARPAGIAAHGAAPAPAPAPAPPAGRAAAPAPPAAASGANVGANDRARRGQAPGSDPSPVDRILRYGSSLGVVMPWFLWPFVMAGLLLPGARRLRPELIAFAPLALTSLAIVLLLAIDPRTQLLLAPALAWYAARGIGLAAEALEQRAGPMLRPGFVRVLCAGTALLVLLGMDARRLWLGLGGDALHQVVGSANRQVGEALQHLVPADESVMSWNPAIAVWAGRDWRPLPTDSLPRILRFADATSTHWVVFSTLNPSPLPKEQMPKAFLIARLLPGAAAASSWSIRVSQVAEQHAVGTIGPSGAGEGTWPR